jgi:hypothetical protein
MMPAQDHPECMVAQTLFRTYDLCRLSSMSQMPIKEILFQGPATGPCGLLLFMVNGNSGGPPRLRAAVMRNPSNALAHFHHHAVLSQ